MRALLIALSVVALAGCSAGSAPTPAPTPHPAWTQADIAACNTAWAASSQFEDAVSAADRQIVTALQPGDIAAARADAKQAAQKALTALGTGSDSACRQGTDHVRSALSAGVAAFGGPMTADQYRAAFSAITAAAEELFNESDAVQTWVQNNVPQ